MAKKRNDVELVISARDEATVPLRDIMQAVKQLTGAADDFRDSADMFGGGLSAAAKAADALTRDLKDLAAAREVAEADATAAKAQIDEANRLKKLAEQYQRATEQLKKLQAQQEKKPSEARAARIQATQTRLGEVAGGLRAAGIADPAQGVQAATARLAEYNQRLQQNQAVIRAANTELERRKALLKSLEASQKAESDFAAKQQEASRIARAEQFRRLLDERDAREAAQAAAKRQADEAEAQRRKVEDDSRKELFKEKQQREERRRAIKEQARIEREAAAQRAAALQEEAQRELFQRREQRAARREALREQNRLNQEAAAAAQKRAQAEAQAAQSRAGRGRDEVLRREADGYRRATEGARKYRESLDRLNEGGRTTLDFSQRLRGQLLSLAAGFVGVFTAVDQFNKALEESRVRTGNVARLQTIFGDDPLRIGKELEFIRSNADRLGQDFITVSEAYTRFAAAAVGSGATLDEVRTIYVKSSEAAAVLGLSQEDLKGTFKAFEQIFSKGKIQAEELSQQLGDRLPGAISIMAKAVGVSNAELFKLMEQGKLTADVLDEFAVALGERYGKGLEQALGSPTTALKQLGNASQDLRNEFSKEFNPGFVVFLRSLTDALKDPETIVAARELGKALADFLKVLVENKEAIKAFLFIFAGGIIGKTLGAFLTTLRNLLPVLRTALSLLGVGTATASATGAVALSSLAGVWGALAGAIVFATGKLEDYLAKQKQVSSGPAGDVDVTRLQQLQKGLVQMMRTEADLEARLRRGEAAGRTSSLEGLRKELERVKADRVARQKEIIALEKALATNTRFAAEAEDVRKREEGRFLQMTKAPETAPRSKPLTEPDTKQSNLVDSLEDQLATLRASVLRKDEDSLRSQIEAIGESLAKVYKDIAEVQNPQRRAQLKADLDDIRKLMIEQVYAADAMRTAAERSERAETDYNRALTQREEELRRVQQAEEDGRISASAARDERVRVYNDAREALLLYLDALIKAKQAEAETPGLDGKRVEEINQQVAALEKTRATINVVRSEGLFTVKELRTQIEDGLVKGFEQFGEAIGKFVVEGGSLKDVFKSAGDAARQFFADILKFTASKLLRDGVEKLTDGLVDSIGKWVKGINDAASEGAFSSIFASIGSGMKDAFSGAVDFLSGLLSGVGKFFSNMLSGFFGQLGGAAAASVFHTGGIVGQGSGAQRRVSPLAFVGATRYHSGGVVGLRPDEMPAVLRKGEEVLTASDPRHRNNGGGAAPVQKQPINVINTIDTDSLAQAALSSPSGTTAVLNIIRANKNAIKGALA